MFAHPGREKVSQSGGASLWRGAHPAPGAEGKTHSVPHAAQAQNQHVVNVVDAHFYCFIVFIVSVNIMLCTKKEFCKIEINFLKLKFNVLKFSAAQVADLSAFACCICLFSKFESDLKAAAALKLNFQMS